MAESVAFVIYAGLFRLAIVAVGALSIWLGYRLFATLAAASSGSGARSGGDTEAAARFGELQFGIKRAAPGTCFALFGAALIAVMLAQGLPEFRQEAGGSVSGPARTLAMKGQVPSASPDFDAALQEADTLMAAGDRAAATQVYARALTDPEVPLGAAARALNQLGWLAHLDGRHERAATLAELAVGLAPDNPDYLDTLGRAKAELARQTAEPASAGADR